VQNKEIRTNLASVTDADSVGFVKSVRFSAVFLVLGISLSSFSPFATAQNASPGSVPTNLPNVRAFTKPPPVGLDPRTMPN
jgi:hypothetical protein